MIKNHLILPISNQTGFAQVSLLSYMKSYLAYLNATRLRNST